MTKIIILLILAVILMIINIVSKPKKMKLRNKKKKRNRLFLNKIDKIIKKHQRINEKKEDYVTKLTIILHKDKQVCNTYILLYITMSIIVSLAVFFILSLIVTAWYSILVVTISSFYMVIYSGIMYIKIKINKVYEQFPEALQVFTDEYISAKNIKKSIDNSYSRMPSQIGIVFETMSREMSSGRDYKDSILDMAGNLSYIWGYSFAQILLMSYEGSGDITDELLYLSQLVSEEITAEEEIKTEMAGNKMIFITLNILTLGIFIMNMVVNTTSKYLYFYTPNGNALMTIWLIVLGAGITLINISEKV